MPYWPDPDPAPVQNQCKSFKSRIEFFLNRKLSPSVCACFNVPEVKNAAITLYPFSHSLHTSRGNISQRFDHSASNHKAIITVATYYPRSEIVPTVITIQSSSICRRVVGRSLHMFRNNMLPSSGCKSPWRRWQHVQKKTVDYRAPHNWRLWY
jgi:hypothetical protein